MNKKILTLLCCVGAIVILTGCNGWETAHVDDGHGGQKQIGEMLLTGTLLQCPPGTPPGERCLGVAKTPIDWGGSEKIAVVFTKVQGENNTCKYTNKKTGVVTFAQCGIDFLKITSEKDRPATLSGAVIGSATQLGVAQINRMGRVEAAEKAEGDTWIISPRSYASSGSSSYSAPQQLQYTNAPSSSIAVQDTGIGIGMSQETGGGCSSGKCYGDPH